jgi:Na+/H+ antiporter NhaD/arsenite permease-like protein
LLGSVANLIVVQRARREVEISFWEYFKAGVPLTVATITLGVLML